MPPTPHALEVFHPLIRRWFEETLGEPTEVQAEAWPRIAAGEHLLVSAPTGTGKTLTALLWALHQLLTGEWPSGQVRVLYVSPLKALNNDIQRNLLTPLAALESAFDKAGEAHNPVQVMTRSGDTPTRERQRMVRRPPEILITTPESLNILLTSRGGRSILTGIQSVIFDEIHAAAGSKRGTHWVTAVDRLVPLSGEFQRIALSATARPLDTIARFIGGYSMQPLDERGAEAEFTPRPVAVVSARGTKQYDLSVDVAGVAVEGAADAAGGAKRSGAASNESAWEGLARELLRHIEGNTSTLVFANSRRSTERLTRLLNESAGRNLVYSHHGSLARELRTVVEQRLKAGELKGIVATNSLELGIDIGALDEVALVQTPPTVASAIQRVGRAGHGVGEVSRGRLYPLFQKDLLSAAVVGRCVLDGAIEDVAPIEGALDVLAQVILSMTAAEVWDIDALYTFLRSSYPYHRTSRRQFDLVLEMLAGRYADSRIRELSPRVTIDRVANTIQGRRGAAWAVYTGGGTIPDRGYFQLRLAESMARIGELDEEFVWERRVGDTFSLGAQNWRVRQITHSDVLVSPAHRSAAMTPFWRADARNRSFFLSQHIGDFLETAEAMLTEPDGRERLIELLGERSAMSPAAATQLVDLLERQREATGGALPHRRHLLVEYAADVTDQSGGRQVILHTGWGGRVNRPLAMALAAAWAAQSDLPLSIEAENDCIMIVLQTPTKVPELLEWVRPDNLETLLRGRLQQTGLFGGRFRENAGRALLLPRSDAKRRVPLWLTRERAKKLLEAVADHEDFPIVVETWRSCLQETFDLASAKRVLDELAAGEIHISEVTTSSPSPFAAELVWQQTNRLMYEDDVPDSPGGGLSRTLLQELVFSSQLRPELPEGLIDTFGRKLQRTFPGYAPLATEDVVAWLDERLALPEDEWEELLAARRRQQSPDDTAELLSALQNQACWVENGDARWVSSLGRLPRTLRGLGLTADGVALKRIDAPQESVDADFSSALTGLLAAASVEATRGEQLADFLGEWLRFYGPIAPADIVAALALDPPLIDAAVARLIDDDRLVLDRFRRASTRDEVCDVDNLERLLRQLRAAARPSFEPLPLDQLPLFLAAHQGLVERGDGIEGLQQALDGLLLYPAPAACWEGDLLPARLDPYYPAWLDAVVRDSALEWFGTGRERVTFGFPEERELLVRVANETATEETTTDLSEELEAALAGGQLRSFEELLRAGGGTSEELTAILWQAVWDGRLSNSHFGVLRRALQAGFKGQAVEPSPRRPHLPSRRRGFDRWRASRPFDGDWYALPASDEPADPLASEELGKERARLLLARYGIVFRQLLERETSTFQWTSVFRALRLMELSGEVLSGHFFTGLDGPQFITRDAWRRLSEGLPQDAVYWLSTVDPASPSGLGLDAWRGRWPARRPSNHLVFAGARSVVRSQRHGAELEIEVPPEHPELENYLEFLKVLLTRDFAPRKALDVESINGDAAVDSPYADTLRTIFSTTREPKCLRLRRRY